MCLERDAGAAASIRHVLSAPKVTTTYGYDKLNRLTTSAGPASNTYKYDKAGNRTQWVTNKAPDTGKALTVNATYNGAGQLTSESKTRPALLGSSTVSTSYTHDANGNRTKSQTGLSSATYKYTDDNKVAEVNQTGRKVTTGYDGLGRALTNTTSSLLILGSTTTQVWDGYDVVQQSTGSATTNLVRDVTGDVAIQTTPGLLGTTPQWGLTDRLGSTIAQASGSRVGQLAKYSDWGIPTFTSVGFTSRTGYTGELGDTTAGLNHYYARTYEPTSASWLTADPYRGTMTDPGSMARYAYVEGNPTTLEDLYGYASRSQLETRQMGGGGKTLVKGSHSGGPTTPNGDPRFRTERHGPTCGVAGRPGCGGFSLGGAVFDSIFGPLVGFTRALGSTILGVWDYSPINLIGQALFLGPAAALQTIQRQGMGLVALGRSLYEEPVVAPVRGVGEAFGGSQWATAPGQAAGTAAFTIASLAAAPAGIAAKSGSVAKAATVAPQGLPKASSLAKYASEQGWIRSQSSGGPLKFVDENGIVRMTIKQGSDRAPGSNFPHVELRNEEGVRVDPAGNPVERRSPDNHTRIEWDLN